MANGLYSNVFYPEPGEVEAAPQDPRTLAAKRRAASLRAATTKLPTYEDLAEPEPVPEDEAEFEEAPADPGLRQAYAAPMDPGAGLPGVDPRLAEVIAGGAQDPAKAAMLQRAKLLMGGDMPRGRQIGNMFVASSPLEMASAAAREAIGAHLLKKGTPTTDTRTPAAQAALGLPDDQRNTALLLSADPGLRQAGTALLGQKSKEDDRDLKSLLFERRIANMSERDKRLFEQGLARDAAKQKAADERARLGRAAAQKRADTMAASGKPLTNPQATAANRVAQGVNAMDNVLDTMFPSPEPLKGTAQNIGEKVAKLGAPGLVSEDTSRRASAWTDAIDPVVRIRTGAAMPEGEWDKMEVALRPKGGMSKQQQIEQAQKYMAHLESGLIGIDPEKHPDVKVVAAKLAELKARLPQNEEEYDIFQRTVQSQRAARGKLAPRPGYTGAAGSAPAPAPAGTPAVPQVRSAAEYEALPAGTKYTIPPGVDPKYPNGVTKTKR